MRLKMFAVAIFTLFFVAGSALAADADVTGSWVAERAARKGGPGGGMGPSGPMKWTFNLKAEGSKLSGTVQGPMGAANEIQEGKIAGDKVSFFVKIDAMGNEMKIKYDGTVSGDEISFKTTFEGGMGGMGGGGPGGGKERPPLIAKKQK